jgi:hypothetical protein
MRRDYQTSCFVDEIPDVASIGTLAIFFAHSARVFLKTSSLWIKVNVCLKWQSLNRVPNVRAVSKCDFVPFCRNRLQIQ